MVLDTILQWNLYSNSQSDGSAISQPLTSAPCLWAVKVLIIQPTVVTSRVTRMLQRHGIVPPHLVWLQKQFNASDFSALSWWGPGLFFLNRVKWFSCRKWGSEDFKATLVHILYQQWSQWLCLKSPLPLKGPTWTILTCIWPQFFSQVSVFKFIYWSGRCVHLQTCFRWARFATSQIQKSLILVLSWCFIWVWVWVKLEHVMLWPKTNQNDQTTCHLEVQRHGKTAQYTVGPALSESSTHEK